MSTTSEEPARPATNGSTPSRRPRTGVLELIGQSRSVLGSDARSLPGLVALSFFMGLIEAALVYLVVQMAVALAAGTETFDFVLGPISAVDVELSTGSLIGVALVAVLIVCLFPVARASGRLPARAQERTRQRLLTTYLNASWSVRARYPEGHLQELLTTYTTRAERAVTQLVQASIAGCGLVAIVLTAFVASPFAAGGSIVCVGAIGFCLRPLMLRTRAASMEYAESDRQFAGRAAEMSRMTPEIAAFDVAAEVSAQVAAHASSVSASLQRIRTFLRLGTGFYQYAALLLILLSVAAASTFVDGPELATVGGVLLLLVRALTYGQQLQAQIQQAQETGPFLDRMRAEIDELEANAVGRDGVQVPLPTPLRFDDVWFSYVPGTDVLSGISFYLDAGDSLGIIGRSGAGKSTIVQLLLRLQTPTGGRITAAGQDLTGIAPTRWAELVSYVPQENKLIRGSVIDNIRFYRPHLSDEAIRSAARRAHIHDDIQALPDGYHTEVGPGARDLSGGQRQRLGIARALAGDPRLIVLDEPTSALDSRSEQLVAETLRELHGSITTIIVAHRTATLDTCDLVLRVANGTGTIESGPHVEFTRLGALPEAEDAGLS